MGRISANYSLSGEGDPSGPKRTSTKGAQGGLHGMAAASDGMALTEGEQHMILGAPVSPQVFATVEQDAREDLRVICFVVHLLCLLLFISFS